MTADSLTLLWKRAGPGPSVDTSDGHLAWPGGSLVVGLAGEQAAAFWCPAEDDKGAGAGGDNAREAAGPKLVAFRALEGFVPFGRDAVRSWAAPAASMARRVAWSSVCRSRLVRRRGLAAVFGASAGGGGAGGWGWGWGARTRMWALSRGFSRVGVAVGRGVGRGAGPLGRRLPFLLRLKAERRGAKNCSTPGGRLKMTREMERPRQQ